MNEIKLPPMPSLAHSYTWTADLEAWARQAVELDRQSRQDASAAQAVPGARQIAWSEFAGYLIDHHERKEITEEAMQAALYDMLHDPEYATQPSEQAQPMDISSGHKAQPPAPPFPALEKVAPLYTAPLDEAAIRNAALESAIEAVATLYEQDDTPFLIEISRAIEALKTDQQEQK